MCKSYLVTFIGPLGLSMLGLTVPGLNIGLMPARTMPRMAWPRPRTTRPFLSPFLARDLLWAWLIPGLEAQAFSINRRSAELFPPRR